MGFQIEISQCQTTIVQTLALCKSYVSNVSGVSKIFVMTGHTDMRKSFDGLMAMHEGQLREADPYSNALFLLQKELPKNSRLYTSTRMVLS